MIRKIFGVFALALVVVTVLAAAGVLYAQRSGGMQDMMRMMPMMEDCPMASAAAQGPQAALRHGEELGLTDTQVHELEALQSETEEDRAQAMQRMHAVHREIAQATEAEPFDEQAVRSAYERMGELRTTMGVAMARSAHEAGNVLTSEQSERLRESTGGMRGMMRMMEACPMMGGMMGGMGGMGGGK